MVGGHGTVRHAGLCDLHGIDRSENEVGFIGHRRSRRWSRFDLDSDALSISKHRFQRSDSVSKIELGLKGRTRTDGSKPENTLLGPERNASASKDNVGLEVEGQSRRTRSVLIMKTPQYHPIQSLWDFRNSIS